MKISFWIPAVVLYMVRGAFSNYVHVGTVLFTKTDLVKKCWTENDKSLLKARLIMQDVLPDPDCIDFSNEEAVAILLDYFHSCYEIISKSTYGKLQNLMYLALSDAVGGYLRAYVLPFTRRSYYAGQVSYEEAKKLFQLYDDIRVFLKTNGVGWAEPREFTFKKFQVKPLVITGGALEACRELYVIERKGKFHCMNSDSANVEKESKLEDFPFDLDSTEHLKMKRRRFAKTKKQLSFYNFINSCGGGGGEMFVRNWNRTRGASKGRRVRQCNPHDLHVVPGDEITTRVVVPLPVLDDCVTPHSIAVPFVKQPFRNLKTGCSAFVLEDYYTAVVKCFIAKGNSRTDIKNFNGQFYSWLKSQVLPHLDEEQWYPGFGGVLRVLQTIKKFGLEMGGSDPVLHDIAFMFQDGAEFEMADSFKEKGKNKVRDVAVEEIDSEFPNSQRHIITSIIIVSMIWLFIFCTFAFYCQATRGHRLLYEVDKPSSGHQKSCSGHQESYSGHQKSYSGHQEGYSGHQKSYSGHQEGYSGHQKSYLGHQEGYSGHQKSCSGHQEGYSGHQKSYSGHQEGYSGHQEGYSGHQKSCSGHQEGYSGHQKSYSGHQEGYSGQHSRDCSREEGRNLNFQFLVKFFKRNNEVQNKDSDNTDSRLAKHRETVCMPAATNAYHSHYSRWDCGDQSLERRPPRRHRNENFCFSALLPGQPFLTSFDKPQKLNVRSGGDARYLDKGQGDRIQMLWKKPSLFFGDSVPSRDHKPKKYENTESSSRRTTTDYCSTCLERQKRGFHYSTNSSSMVDETKGYTSEKQTSACNCSENCPFAYTRTTSSTQLAGKLSSATMNFFEEVIAKHKARKSSIQDSTAESETECCTSSETDY